MIDKSTWGDGPWQHEPDELDWVDEVTGLRCQAWRNPHMGMWCGYVGVPLKHPLYSWTYNDPALECLEVHGGLSFADERNGLWWFGFDCGHYCDISPGMQAYQKSRLPPHLLGPDRGQEYRDLAYVHRECTNLAWQLHRLTESITKTQSSFGGDEG